MREGGKGLRRLGFAALFMLAASAAAAQTQQFSTDQRNLACGSPTSLNDGWPAATPESVGLDGPRGIVPELDLVMVTTSGLYGSPRKGSAALDILANFIIPYVRDNNTR